MKTIWPDTFVEEANLSRNIFLLRKALGESPQDHQYIVTVLGRGYRFTEDVQLVTDRELLPASLTRICHPLRLKPLLPSWLPWIRQRYAMSAKTEQQLLAVNARQMDRRLAKRKRERRRRIYGTTKPRTLLKHHIPVKTDRWNVTRPLH